MLLPLLTDQLSGQLDDHSSKPDHEASSQLLSSILEVLDRKDVVSCVIYAVQSSAGPFTPGRRDSKTFLVSGSPEPQYWEAVLILERPAPSVHLWVLVKSTCCWEPC